MKTFLLLLVILLTTLTTKAQYSEDFEGGEASLTGGCWSLTDVHATGSPADVITGAMSLYTNPPVSGAGTRDLVSPALIISSASFTVSFNYKVSSKIAGNATRTIEVGLLDPSGNFTSLTIIVMDKNTPTTVHTFYQTFTLASTGIRKLVLKFGGAIGDGNSRIIIDDLFASATPLYASGCNTAPIAVDDVFSGEVGTPISGNVILNDNDPNGELIYSAMVVNSPDGVVVLNQDGTFTFTPNVGFLGSTTTFTYQLTDNGFAAANSNIATVTLNFVSSIPLPVKLISFTAQLNSNNKVDLKWSTATEINASHFIIERSYDGVEFGDAGLVFASGNSTEIKHYQFTDNAFSSTRTILYYRIRQVDADNKSDYSPTRIIRLGKTEATTILTYPNPVVNDLRITVPNNWQGKPLTYEMISAGGQLVKKLVIAASSQTETVDLSTLAPGIYMVKVVCNGAIAQQKIIKQ